MKLAFIGGGNMAQALLGGMQAAAMDTAAMDVLEPDAARGEALARSYGVTPHTAAGEWLRGRDVLVLAVKPQQARAAVAAATPWLAQPLVVSIMAGVRGATLARWLGHARIVRAMPNTPALIRVGISGAVALAGATVADRDRADAILRAVGSVVWLQDEEQLDVVTALSGSGPAYVYYFIEALQRSATALGLGADEARALAAQTFRGAALLALESPEPLATLRERVTSKGGTTAAGLSQLAAHAVADAIDAAVRAARDRAADMGREFDAD